MSDPVNWHPSRNAFPTAWEFRNGQHADAYGRLVRLSRGRYQLFDRYGKDLGEWTDPDAAAVYPWETTSVPRERHA